MDLDLCFSKYFPKESANQCCHDFVEDGMFYCRKCGHSEPIIVEKKYTYVERPIVVSVPYKRINHFKERLTQLMGLENIVIPEEVLELCRGCKDHEEIKSLLQKNRQKKYYEHVYSILKHLGKPIPFLDKPEIERLIYLFNRFNEVYEKNKKLTNAINYHYLLSKLLPLIQRPDVVPHLYRIRNPRKLKEHDKTINLVFTELEWV